MDPLGRSLAVHPLGLAHAMTFAKVDRESQQHEKTPPPVSSKEGEYYDVCPRDQCLEVDRQFKNGGKDGKGHEYLSWSMYNADPRRGGCGYTWARTTPQGIAKDHAKGIDTKWGTRSAETGRSYSLPSQAYQDGWERIFGSSSCPAEG